MSRNDDAFGHFYNWLVKHEYPSASFYNLRSGYPAIGVGYMPIIQGGQLRGDAEQRFREAGRALSTREVAALRTLAREAPKGNARDRGAFNGAVQVLGNVRLTEAQIEYLAASTFPEYRDAARRLVGEDTFDALDPARRAVLSRLAYRMGEGNLGKYGPELKKHLQAGDWDGAARVIQGIQEFPEDRSRFRTEADLMRDPELKGKVVAPAGNGIPDMARMVGATDRMMQKANPGVGTVREGMAYTVPQWADKELQAQWERTLFPQEQKTGVGLPTGPVKATVPLPYPSGNKDPNPDPRSAPRRQFDRSLAPIPIPGRPSTPPQAETKPRRPFGFDNLFPPEEPETPKPHFPEGFDNLFPPEQRGPEPRPIDEPLPYPEVADPLQGFYYHQGGEVSDGDPATDNPAAKAVVQEGEFVLAKATVEGIDAELVKALNDLAKADPARAKKLRGALAAAVGDHPPYGEEQLRKMMAESRHYWDPESPHREEAFLRMARLYQQAFPEGDAEGRTVLAEGGLVAGKHWQRKNEDVPTELPEGSFVLSQEAVKAYGADVLELLNAAGIVKDRFALTEVRKAIAAAQGKRLKLREDELRRLMADPRYWKHVNSDYIRMVTDEYRHTYAHLNK